MKRNQGFSLVELIIVIAIMAILVGVMAPQLIKYIEKTNIASDTQLCDSVRTALLTTLSDPALLMSDDPQVKQHLAALKDTRSDPAAYPYEPLALTHFGGINQEIRDTMEETLGFDAFDGSEARQHMKSSPAKTNGVFSLYSDGSGTFIVFIVHSDRTGAGQDCNPGLDASNLGNVIMVD